MLKREEKEKRILKQIKQTILEVAKNMNIEIDKIILFGSRARGDAREGSDWDILIVTKEKLDNELEDEFWLKCSRKLYNILLDNFDLLIINYNDYKKKSKFRDYVYYYANKEGLKI